MHHSKSLSLSQNIPCRLFKFRLHPMKNVVSVLIRMGNPE